MNENIRHEWYGLSPANREALVLELLSKGYTANALNDYFNVKTNRVIADFMNARGYSKKNNTYIPKQQAEHVSIAPIIPQQPINLTPNIQIDEETISNVIKVSKHADKIQELIEWYDSLSPKELSDPVSSYIEVIDTSLPIPKVNGEVKRTTIRVNDTIMAAFNAVWKDKYSEYKQHDLLNLALQMFIDKYK